MSTRFRQCTEADLSVVQTFVDELYVSDPDTAEVHADITLTYRDLFARPEKGAVIVFEGEAGKLIGYCIIIFFWSNEYRGNILEIDEIFVESTQRRKGVTRQLFDWLEKHFADKIVGFALQISANNVPALHLVEKEGFVLSRNQHLIRLFSAASS